jgi:Lrp/AsnC family transcriptional regulator, leucine-responsive regulatory protein
MDNIDIQLLKLLQENSRSTISELSTQLALSRPSISERIHRLQERGMIEEYSARVSLHAIGRDILLIILVSELKVSLAEFEEMIQKEKEVIECHRVTGEVTYIIKAAVSNMNGMRQLIDRLVSYGKINTSTVLTSPVPYRHILPIEQS